jgi:DNA-binding XRE family transcriptional regulator
MSVLQTTARLLLFDLPLCRWRRAEREAEEGEMTITAAQFKAAHRLFGWSQSRLAGEADVSATTIATVEDGERKMSVLPVSSIRKVLEGAGVEFVGEAGGEDEKTAVTSL